MLSSVKNVAIFGFHRNLIKTISQYHVLNVKTHIGIGPKNPRNKVIPKAK
jgi:hypothetical protein